MFIHNSIEIWDDYHGWLFCPGEMILVLLSRRICGKPLLGISNQPKFHCTVHVIREGDISCQCSIRWAFFWIKAFSGGTAARTRVSFKRCPMSYCLPSKGNLDERGSKLLGPRIFYLETSSYKNVCHQKKYASKSCTKMVCIKMRHHLPSIHLPSNKRHKLTVFFLVLGAQILRFPTI